MPRTIPNANTLYKKGKIVEEINPRTKKGRKVQEIIKDPLHFTTRRDLLRAKAKFEKQLVAGYAGMNTPEEIKEKLAYIEKALKSKELGKGLA